MYRCETRDRGVCVGGKDLPGDESVRLRCSRSGIVPESHMFQFPGPAALRRIENVHIGLNDRDLFNCSIAIEGVVHTLISDNAAYLYTLMALGNQLGTYRQPLYCATVSQQSPQTSNLQVASPDSHAASSLRGTSKTDRHPEHRHFTYDNFEER